MESPSIFDFIDLISKSIGCDFLQIYSVSTLKILKSDTQDWNEYEN